MSMSKQDRDKRQQEEKTTTTTTTTIKDQEELNKRRAANTAPPEEAPEAEQESEEDKKAREAAEGTRKGIILRLKERDGQLNEDETKELQKINEDEIKAGKAQAKKEE